MIPIYAMDYQLIEKSDQARHLWYRFHKTTHHKCILYLFNCPNTPGFDPPVSYDFFSKVGEDELEQLKVILKQVKDTFPSTLIITVKPPDNYNCTSAFYLEFDLVLEAM